MPSLLRKVGSSSLGFLVGRGLAGLAGVLILRALGPERSGVYGAAVGFAAVFSVGATLGMDSALAGAVGRDPAGAGPRWSAALVQVALQALIMGLLLALFLRLGGGAKVPPALVLTAFAVLAINGLGQVSAGAMQGLGQFGRQALLGSAASALNAAGLLTLLVVGGVGVASVLRVALLTALLGAGLWWWGRPAGLAWRRPRSQALAQSWRLGLPFAMVTLGNLLFLKVDQVLLAYLVLPAALGLYVAAVRLVDLLVPALAALFNPLHPHLAERFTRAAGGDAVAAAQAHRALDRGLKYMAAISWPLGVGGSLLAPFIVRALYGPAFGGAAAALALLVWVAVLWGLQGALMQAVHGLGRTALLARLFAASFALNVVLNLAFIPRYGILASASISVVGEVLNLGFLWWWCRRSGLGLSLKTLLWPGLPAALAMGALLVPARTLALGLAPILAVALLVAAGAGVYLALLVGLGFMGPEEWALLARLRPRAS